jgi:hypothetical protein
MDFDISKIKYVPPTNNKKNNRRNRNKRYINKSNQYARGIYNNKLDRYNTDLNNDYKLLLNGSSYIPNFICKTNDMTIYNNLKKELEENNNNMIQWSKHFKYEDPTFSKTFNEIINKMADYFNVDVMATRLNYYPNEKSYKPLHHDKNAYGNCKEDYTMGISIGSRRELQFIHVKTNKSFRFPQNNGDCFSFDKDVNINFKHGVPKKYTKTGDRFSIIAWGKLLDIN